MANPVPDRSKAPRSGKSKYKCEDCGTKLGQGEGINVLSSHAHQLHYYCDDCGDRFTNEKAVPNGWVDWKHNK